MMRTVKRERATIYDCTLTSFLVALAVPFGLCKLGPALFQHRYLDTWHTHKQHFAYELRFRYPSEAIDQLREGGEGSTVAVI